ncbi:oxidoreductase-like protein [Deinococcus aerius]|uniref:Oxidoreductase-like protein n=1 Tax=Deinococcus aerius TaxID=200253 RepID=A0A2I9CW33_9DEIO|nr:Gfo/Idh/MocA family oxidoreductase [Deinococcus aerius]GBF06172.1 oxidoreductase-like protein [Deinococcus aerius]
MSLRWGFLGASRIGNVLAPAMKAAGQRLVGVAARDPERAAAYAGKHGFVRAHDTYEALLNDPEIDAIYNALPNDLHFPWSVKALQAGKHVLCEKPFMLNADEVLRVMEVQRQAGRVIMEAFVYRHHPQFGRALAAIARGELGELRTATAYYRFRMTNPGDYRWNPARGGGALYDVGCYCVSALRLLLGREPRRVSASLHDVGGIDATLVGWLDFGGGFTAHFDCSVEASGGQHLSLVGSGATLSLDVPYGSHQRTTTLQIGEQTEVYDPTDPYEAMVAHFAAAALEGAELRWGLPDALAQARVLDALFGSARTGRVLEVPQPEPRT